MLFADLSFAVGGGEALLLLGPNGAGKTTLIRTHRRPAGAGCGHDPPRRRRRLSAAWASNATMLGISTP